MLKIKLIVSVLMLIPFSLSAQNYWKTETTTSFSVQSNTQVTSFVDANGIHIVYSRNGGIKYALVNSNGVAINGKYDKVIEAEGAGTNYANAVSIDNDVYVFYLKNNKIQMAKSTNLGDTWNNNFDNWPMTYYDCNSVVGYLVGQEIHIVWSETRINGYQPESHYIKFVPNLSNRWQNYYRVTDVEPEGGGKPEVAVSTDKVHVDYIPSYPLNIKSRTRLANGTWETPQFVPYYLFPLTTPVLKVKPIITGSNLNEIYRADYGTIGVYGSYIGHSYRPLNSSTWIQNPDIIYTSQGKTHLVSKTSDNKIHIISFDEQQNTYVHRTIDGTTLSGIIANVPFYELSNKLTSNSNDLYLLHAGNVNVPSPIFFRHFDAVPLAPTNLTVSVSANNHPLLNWTKNNEADIQHYKIYKYVTSDFGWQPCTTLTTNSFEDLNESYPVKGGSGLTHPVQYRVTAVDYHPYESLPSNTVVTNVSGALMEKHNSGELKPTEYSLDQNYPNPFNPITKITYSIKEEGLVTLKVYDILGKEIATLVNENKPTGVYEAEFNASQLPSGMYIYKIQSSNFTSSKKMLLMK